ncbi:hypothetical protein RZ56_02960 [Apilactobacillus kunkeei]|nr:hypothetical protein RZ56_02960 [Apilactobacillus kunkeei]
MNSKPKNHKLLWTIIIVIAALVVVGFVNNNNNGSPFSFSKTPQKMIEDAGGNQAWEIKTSVSDQSLYYKFKDDNYLSGSVDNKNYTDIKIKYNFVSNDTLDFQPIGDNKSSDFKVEYKDLKVSGNKITGTMDGNLKGHNITASFTMTPVSSNN